MKLERKKNAIRNIEIGVLNKTVTIICPFILRTILIRELGTEYLGLGSLFTSILQVLNLTELGMGSAMSSIFTDRLRRRITEGYVRWYLYINMFIE